MRVLITKKGFPLFILVLTLLGSCKKLDRVNFLKNQQIDGIENKVERWLDRQKKDFKYSQDIRVESNAINSKNADNNHDANINLVKRNLTYSNLRKETQNQNFNFIIIPINDEVSNKKSLNPNGTLNLFLTVDHRDSIIDGYIAYFEPSDKKKRSKISANTFHNIFNNKTVDDDGVYHFLTVSGSRKFDMTYKNGKLFSISHPISKNGRSNKSQNSSILCIDWYLITTYYYPNGTTERMEEYVGTTCNDCDDPNFMNLCSTSGGGGGGYSNDTTQVSDSSISNELELITEEEMIDLGPEEEQQLISQLPPDGSNAGYAAPFQYSFHSYLYTVKDQYGTVVELVDIRPIAPTLKNPSVPFVSPVWGSGIRDAHVFGFGYTKFRLTKTAFLADLFFHVGAWYKYTLYPWVYRVYDRSKVIVVGA